MLKELKEKKSLYNIYKKNIIDLDEYFAYSGKIEVKGKFIDKFDEYTYKEKTIIKNDMSKYVLKIDVNIKKPQVYIIIKSGKVVYKLKTNYFNCSENINIIKEVLKDYRYTIEIKTI